MYRILNALGFQVGWWACVASVRFDREAEALILCGVFVAMHLRHCAAPLQELKLGLFSLALGIVVDSTLQYFSVIRFLGFSASGLSPLWSWMLWVIFAMTLNNSMGFLQARSWKVSAALGMIFGPVSYLAGANLQAAVFDFSARNIGALAAVWLVVLPILVWVGKRLHAPDVQMKSGEDRIGGG